MQHKVHKSREEQMQTGIIFASQAPSVYNAKHMIYKHDLHPGL